MAARAEKIIDDAVKLSGSGGSVDEIISDFGKLVLDASGAEKAVAKSFIDEKEKPMQSEEAVLRAGMHYIDNSISGYSAYSDIIGYHNAGFRSCMVIPISDGKKGFGSVTLLSKKEEFFSDEHGRLFTNASRIVAQGIAAREGREMERETNLLYEASFGSRVPQIILDAKSRIVRMNSAAAHAAGAEKEAAAGALATKFFKGIPEPLAEGRVSIVAEGSGTHYTAFLHRAGALLYHVLLEDETQALINNRMERLLRISREEIFLSMDQKMNVIWVGGNPEALRLDGELLKGRKFASLVAGETREALLHGIADEGGGTYIGKVNLAMGNGIEVRADISMARNEDGYIAVLAKDMERYISSISESLAGVISLSPDFVVVVDGDGFIRKANRSSERLLKYGNGELEGLPVTRICKDEESLDRFGSGLDLARKREVVTDLFMKLSDKEGNEIPVLQNIRAMNDPEGGIEGYILIGKELLTKRNLEEARAMLDEMFRKAEKSKQESDLKTQFIFNISHELKTPITNINGYAKLLLEGSFGEITKEQEEGVKTIISEGDRLMGFILQILEVAKLEAGKIKLDVQEVDLASIMNNPSIKSLEEMIRNKGLEYEFSIDYSVPKIEADPNRLIQVFVNLLVNAYKFTENGSIKVRAFRKGKNIMVEVRDTGIGINPEDKKVLFKRFYQINKKGLTKQEGSGTGLGLTIVKEIVNLHGGRISVGPESAVGKGSVFWFTIPIHRKTRRKEKETE